MISRTAFSALMAAAIPSPSGRMRAHVPEDWMQGRTTYGGLSAALCLRAALASAEGVPLRSAQVAFVGPVAGDVVVSTAILRRGKNSLFIGADLVGEAGLATRAIFTFGARRESSLSFADLPMPNVPSPQDSELFFNSDRRPGFSHHFDCRLVIGDRPVTASQSRTIGLWLKHIDPDTIPDVVSLLAMADAPPPAALSMLSAPGPVSSMTWMAEFVAEDLTTDDGWYLARHTADTARNGYSSQSMAMWSTSGKPVMVGRQTIAVFS